MRIDKINVTNYKGFNSSQTITLGSGINIITGQNNAGKSSLLEALSLRFTSKPHKSSATVPTVQSPVNSNSVVVAEITLSIVELKELVYGNSILRLPPLHGITDVQKFNEVSLFDIYFHDEVKFSASFMNGGLTEANFLNIKGQLSSSDTHWQFIVDPISKSIRYNQTIGGKNSSVDLITRSLNRIYSFKAERFNISASPNYANSELSGDAQNLPDVLNQLQSNPARFERFNSKIRLVFPQIFRITPISIQSNQVQLNVWMEDPINERNDLAIPLNECGTGLSQVLSILYVVMNSNFPRVIIIDEPNSFLHPGASRKLIEILKDYSQHQFIITTHSTSTLASANPKTIHLLKQIKTETIIESIDVTQTANQQIYLAEIGAKLSDLFGADNILWVEGKTEEICFPMIIEKTKGLSLMGTVVLSVISTGDLFTRKNKELVFDIYRRLSSAVGLMPPALGFIFDSEKLTDTEKGELSKESKGVVKFIPRRMFENYLMNISAIHYVLNESASELSIKKEQIEEWINKNKWNSKYITAAHSKNKSEADWNTNVDGAKFLSDLFSSVSETKISFDKITHSVGLCKWMLENSIEDISELQKLLSEFLKRN